MFLSQTYRLRLRLALHNQRGASLIITLGLAMVLLLLASGMAALIMNFMKVTKQAERAVTAYFAAESGVELALYELMAYRDGYEFDPSQENCVNDMDITGTPTQVACENDKKQHYVDLTESSKARGFWQLFNRALKENVTAPEIPDYVIPNPYFANNPEDESKSKDGKLDAPEWGRLTKVQPISLSLALDRNPSESDPADRYEYLLETAETKIILLVDAGFDAGFGSTAENENIATWILSAVDGNGQEFTLQGVIREDDFSACNENGDPAGSGRQCFILDFQNGPSIVSVGESGHALAGEDINKNIGTGIGSCPNPGNSDCTAETALNRVSGTEESFNFNTITNFLDDLNDSITGTDESSRWRNVRLSISLVSTLAETSGATSNSLAYKVVSDTEIADEYTYIVSEGFAGTVKQTIETRFKRQATIPVFSYAIFQ